MVRNIRTGENRMRSDTSPLIHTLVNRRGFTLIELMIVVSIIGILAAIAAPNYQWGIIKTKESVLKENLYNLRSTIDQFYADQGKYPDALKDLVEKKYMKSIPKDPFTDKDDTWVTIPPPQDQSSSNAGIGAGSGVSVGNVYDVHSGSALKGSNNIPYSEY